MSEEKYNKTSMPARVIKAPIDNFEAARRDELRPGDIFNRNGVWFCVTPGSDPWCPVPLNLPGSECQWSVKENENGTITVSPSIHAVGYWHGYLIENFWRSC